ncbi:ATP synthase F1 subunit gamma [Spiribacter salinus M19-40]|uniref:ATP synthase gamma chain n=1 Tax=Spiribacter salinus M19-40 TaxID=1260251 RepID=R4VA19_9GAMM|nr:F0F1 ATP synthase subunit gamma [Spiribacter salinus]AGM41770.1 ATP synthase F1 subunit gamma [Spiribacter salinus M19-40]MBY5268680.1 F0F1 ATP synthase subunit gamma [Spiribacter salinus]
MSGAKEIRTQIKSVNNTQKITTAMEMVAASKMRGAQKRMQAALPYAEKMRQVISHLAEANPEYQHPFLERRDEVNRVGYIVVSSDRGLCGGLNNNLFRAIIRDLRDHEAAGQEVRLCTIGSKAIQFFSRLSAPVVAEVSQLGDTPRLQDLIGTVKVMMDQYAEGELDRVVICYNRFVNTMTQSPTVEQLLPLPVAEEDQAMARSHSWDYLYEPSAAVALDLLLERYIESLVYQSVVENIACEMAARMVAMKSASDNAGKLIDDLNLAYNKARQAAITTELSEIVAGAEAV